MAKLGKIFEGYDMQAWVWLCLEGSTMKGKPSLRKTWVKLGGNQEKLGKTRRKLEHLRKTLGWTKKTMEEPGKL